MALSGNDVARTLALLTISQEMQPGVTGRDMAAYQTITMAGIIDPWPAEVRAELYARAIEHPGFNGLYGSLFNAYVDSLKAVQRKFQV